jgi:hypothetical protein
VNVTNTRRMTVVVGMLFIVSPTAYGQIGARTSTDAHRPAAVVDANGNLRVPADYRITYESLGSWAVAADQGQRSKEIHAVHASPGTIAAYSKDGRFPDSSVLVKEVFEAATDMERAHHD